MTATIKREIKIANDVYDALISGDAPCMDAAIYLDVHGKVTIESRLTPSHDFQWEIVSFGDINMDIETREDVEWLVRSYWMVECQNLDPWRTPKVIENNGSTYYVTSTLRVWLVETPEGLDAPVEVNSLPMYGSEEVGTEGYEDGYFDGCED